MKKKYTSRKEKNKQQGMSKRSRAKHPNLKPELNLKTRSDLIDFDYLDKLSEEEKDWLNKFSGEFHGASFLKEPKRKKGPGRPKRSKNLHDTPELKKSCYDLNNARNRDIYTRAKASGQFDYLEDIITNEEEFSKKLEESFGQTKKNPDEGADFSNKYQEVFNPLRFRYFLT